MGGMESVVATIAERGRRNNKPEEGDYQNEEGFWVCGQCDGVRETMKRNMRVWVLCPCREAKLEADKEEKVKLWREEQSSKVIERTKTLSLMDSKLQKARFEVAEMSSENERNFSICREYADRFEVMENKSQGLLFYGDVGTGKSYAAACIANELLSRGVPVVLTSLVKLIDRLRGFETDVDAVMTRLRKARLLILDEVGAERCTEFVLEKMYQIIDSRYNSDLPFIITTNLCLGEMRDVQNMELRRIYSRILEKCFPMQWHGESWRNKEAKSRYDDMRAFLEGDL